VSAKQQTKNGSLDSLDRLYNQLVTWLYERQDIRRALPIAHRLKRLLSQFDPRPKSIFVEECRSLVAEATGDLQSAIKHREKEIRLIRRLHGTSQGTESEGYALRQYDYADLSERLDILAMLYHAGGDLGKAIKTLRESRRVCASHRIRFDGEALLRDYQEEKRAIAPPRRSTRKNVESVRLRPTATQTLARA
jgi:hypothetical protein